MKNYRPYVPQPIINLVSLFTELDITDNKVEDPHQPTSKTPPILGHTFFQPYGYPEPLLQPKNGSDGPIYDLFQKSFSPMDKKIIISNYDGKDEEQRVITPSKSSTENLFEHPPSDLVELLPNGAKKEDYLPAIRLAIRLTTWKQAIQEKCKRVWARWQQRHQKTAPEFANWEKDVKDAFDAMRKDVSDKIYPGCRPINSSLLMDWTDKGFEPICNVDQWNEKSTKLEAAFNALQGVLYDYQRYGLLHYRPLADANRSWAVTDNQGVNQIGSSEIFQTIKKVVASWAAVYDMFSHPRIQDDIPSWAEHSWESYTLRQYSNLHRQMQFLPSCLLFNIPIFPNAKDFNESTDSSTTYYGEIIRVVTQTADYLNETLEVALRKAAVAGSQPDSQTLESFRTRIAFILNKGVYKHPPIINPGPLFLIDDLRKMPEHLVEKLPHHNSDTTLLDAAIDAYQDNLTRMEAIFNEVLNFPGTKSV